MSSLRDFTEITKFNQNMNTWWDTEGPFKTLHDINPTRMEFIQKWTLLAQQSVLDIGCGGGILSEAMAKAGATVTGLDAAEQAIHAARAHGALSSLNIHYVTDAIETFVPENEFDIVTCLEMLEHVPQPQDILMHAYRLLKNDGLLFLSTINRTLKAYMTVILGAEYVLNLLPRQTHDYKKFIKPSELATQLQRVGFEVLGIQGLGYNPFTRKALINSDVSMNYLVVCRK